MGKEVPQCQNMTVPNMTVPNKYLKDLLLWKQGHFLRSQLGDAMFYLSDGLRKCIMFLVFLVL